ncbi:MAG: hypothetical protein Q7T79_01485 [bacterium]|nr:hypothetical protein [bacterium]
MSNLIFFQPCSSSACLFDKAITNPILFFEISIVLITIISLFFLRKIQKRILYRYFVIMMGIFIFEFFTAPMWHNYRMGSWAYVYRDVSWILTLGWSTLILIPATFIDVYMVNRKAWERVVSYILSISVLGLFAEALVVNLGIRSYAPETLEAISGNFIPFLNIPWEGVYYIPVFLALVLSFYKYWSLLIDKVLIPPIKNNKLGRNLMISILGVFLFELMIEPMVVNAGLPSWSYIYKDISFIITGGWILIIWLSISIVDKIFIYCNFKDKTILYVLFATIVTLPIEAWLIVNKFRLYGPSATENFSGYFIPLTTVPIEIAFAIPFYLVLIISFIKYWIYRFDIKK